MTAKDCNKILTLIQVEYPHSFERLDERQMALKAELWEREFEADDPKEVYTAVRMIFESGARFAPNIGEIRAKMQMLRKKDSLTEQQAWVLVSKATKNSAYHSEAEFAKLPPEVQKAVGSPEQLKAWAIMDADTVESVVASNFMRSFKSVAARQAELDLYPASLREIIENTKIGEGQKNALPE